MGLIRVAATGFHFSRCPALVHVSHVITARGQQVRVDRMLGRQGSEQLPPLSQAPNILAGQDRAM
ncbi:MAG: hypothetical protein ACI9UA_004829 [Pseudoalteromonas tetraodonis]|jgi:hypothetical protein